MARKNDSMKILKQNLCLFKTKAGKQKKRHSAHKQAGAQQNKLSRPKQVRFCTGVSASLVGVICPIYLLFSTTKFDYPVFWPNYPQKCVIFLQKSSHNFCHFSQVSLKCTPFWGVLELENLVFCCSPLHAFFSGLKNLLCTPLVSKMLQNDTIFLFVLRGLAIRDMQQRN